MGSKKPKKKAGSSKEPKAVASKRKPAKKPVRPPAKKKAARSKAKPKANAKQKKPAPAPTAGEEIGEVIAFFRIPVVAVIKLTQGVLKTGDRIWIKGHTTDMKLTVSSMQINHQPVQEIKKGQEAGIKVPSRARRGDMVYRV
ncbi:MAG: EF-Tu/IF-2/RF-3 family GTPase [Candidatus Omnitrophica bacterium]|nr:EF-Tu/IF-2/RF-3 family GTPase [Candidatus Omnitrophota bacterium]